MANYNGTLLPAFSQPLSADFNGEYDGIFVNLTAPTQYAQRVYSSGLSVWCYYVGAINASPLSSQTTPNWTGAITEYQLLGQV